MDDCENLFTRFPSKRIGPSILTKILILIYLFILKNHQINQILPLNIFIFIHSYHMLLLKMSFVKVVVRDFNINTQS